MRKLLYMRVVDHLFLLGDGVVDFVGRGDRGINTDSEHGQGSTDGGCFTVFDIACLVDVG